MIEKIDRSLNKAQYAALGIDIDDVEAKMIAKAAKADKTSTLEGEIIRMKDRILKLEQIIEKLTQ